jgi:hypothetical protein
MAISGCQKQASMAFLLLGFCTSLGQPKISQMVLMSDVSLCQCFGNCLGHLYFNFFLNQMSSIKNIFGLSLLKIFTVL